LKGAGSTSVNVSLALDFKFTRAAPAEALVARASVNRTLNYSRLDDCHTGKQLKQFVELDCSEPRHPDGSSKNVSILFTKALIPDYVLGQTKSAEVLSRVDTTADTEKVDLRLTYKCLG